MHKASLEDEIIVLIQKIGLDGKENHKEDILIIKDKCSKQLQSYNEAKFDNMIKMLSNKVAIEKRKIELELKKDIFKNLTEQEEMELMSCYDRINYWDKINNNLFDLKEYNRIFNTNCYAVYNFNRKYDRVCIEIDAMRSKPSSKNVLKEICIGNIKQVNKINENYNEYWRSFKHRLDLLTEELKKEINLYEH